MKKSGMYTIVTKMLSETYDALSPSAKATVSTTRSARKFKATASSRPRDCSKAVCAAREKAASSKRT